MTRQGRKPLGPALVDHLPGSSRAKERLEVILQTIAGTRTVGEACDRLGIGEAMFHRLRAGVLQAGLASLEPRPLGRPPRIVSPEQERLLEMQHHLDDLQSELQVAEVREEIARVLPGVMKREPEGKKAAPVRSRQLRRRRNRRQQSNSSPYGTRQMPQPR
jgi:Helix-turn-helix domain